MRKTIPRGNYFVKWKHRVTISNVIEKMAKHFGKGKSTRNTSFRKSQAWRYLSRKDNAENFEGRTVVVNGKGIGEKDQPDGSRSTTNDKNPDQEDLQVHFVGNQIKSSKYTIFTFIPR